MVFNDKWSCGPKKNEYSQSLCIIYKCQVDLVSGSCCLLISLSTLLSLRGMLKFLMIVDWSVLPFSSASVCFQLFWSSSIKCIHIFFSVVLMNWPFEISSLFWCFALCLLHTHIYIYLPHSNCLHGVYIILNLLLQAWVCLYI